MLLPEISQLIQAEKRIAELEAEIARLRAPVATDVESEARRRERLLAAELHRGD